MASSPDIRPATPGDHAAIWSVLEPVIREGETFALPRDTAPGDALAFGTVPGNDAFVAEVAGEILGSYFLHAMAHRFTRGRALRPAARPARA